MRKAVITTNRFIKTAPKLIKNDIIFINSEMGRGGFSVLDSLGNAVGTVRKSDIKLI